MLRRVPLDQRWQEPVTGTLPRWKSAIGGDGETPGVSAACHGYDSRDALRILRLPARQRLRPVHPYDPVHELRAGFETLALRRVVECKEARARCFRCFDWLRVRVDRDHFEIRAAPQVQQAVMRAH